MDIRKSLNILENRIDELSKDTLSRYTKKAEQQYDDSGVSQMRSDDPRRTANKTASKREAGLDMAYAKKRKTTETEDYSDDEEQKPVSPLSKFERKAVQGLYHYDHWEADDGSFFQIYLGTPRDVIYQDANGDRKKFPSVAAFKEFMKNSVTQEDMLVDPNPEDSDELHDKEELDEAEPKETKVRITYCDDYRVPHPNGTEDAAYYTNDWEDAVNTGKEMWKGRDVTFYRKSVSQHPAKNKPVNESITLIKSVQTGKYSLPKNMKEITGKSVKLNSDAHAVVVTNKPGVVNIWNGSGPEVGHVKVAKDVSGAESWIKKHNLTKKPKKVSEAKLSMGSSIKVYDFIKGKNAGLYGTLTVNNVSKTQVGVYDQKTKKVLKFNRKTGHGIGSAEHYMIDPILEEMQSEFDYGHKNSRRPRRYHMSAFDYKGRAESGNQMLRRVNNYGDNPLVTDEEEQLEEQLWREYRTILSETKRKFKDS